MVKYRTIVADPPWPFSWQGGPGGRRARATPKEYATLTVEAIAALPVAALAAPDAHLYLWVTPQLNRRGVGVLVAEAWGFVVVDELIWEKPNLGMGRFPRHCHEPVLVCRRGGLPFGTNNTRSVQRWAQRYDKNGGKRHSAKPEGFYDLVEQVSPGPYLELFARRHRLGWDVWGDQVESSIDIAAG